MRNILIALLICSLSVWFCGCNTESPKSPYKLKLEKAYKAKMERIKNAPIGTRHLITESQFNYDNYYDLELYKKNGWKVIDAFYASGDVSTLMEKVE